MQYADSILDLVGDTLVRISRLTGTRGAPAALLAKSRCSTRRLGQGPIGLPMIEAAERAGLLARRHDHEPTSGNTGHGLAIRRRLGATAAFVMADKQSGEAVPCARTAPRSSQPTNVAPESPELPARRGPPGDIPGVQA
jgi:cysteine synthase